MSLNRSQANAYFAADFAEARAKFLAAANEVGAVLESFEHPELGPPSLSDRRLSTDIAWIGPQDASKLLVTVSATHGVEGFCGSGVQTAWFASGNAVNLPPDTALLQIHAINPHGFAFLRRVTEKNVDLNRNFIDFSKPAPENEGYERYKHLICPREWSDASVAETTAELDRLSEALAPMEMQTAISAGQYSDPQGLFYGGEAPSWSRVTLETILEKYARKAARIVVVDFHTGLGPRGYGERIGDGGPGDTGWDLAQSIWGDVTSTDDGSSTSAPLNGVNSYGMHAVVPEAEFAFIALEFGTLPLSDIILALRADNWLHAHGDLQSAQAKEIKAQIRNAFYQDADDWRDMIWQRSEETLLAAHAWFATV